MKTFVIVIAIVIGFQSIIAQNQKRDNTKRVKDTLKPEVITVITSYTPTISDAFKIKKTPKLKLSKKTEKKQLTYQLTPASVASTFIPKSGVVKGINVGKKERLFDNYVAVGFGNYTTPFAEIFLHQNTKFENEFSVYAKYISSEDGVESTPLKSGYRNLTTGGSYSREERFFSWKLGLNASNDQYNYYGLPNAIDFSPETIASISETQNYNFYELNGEIILNDSYFESIKSSLSHFSDNFGSSEIHFTLSPQLLIPLDYWFRNTDDLKLDTDVQYLNGSFDQSYTNTRKVNYSFLNFGINPYYQINAGDLSFKLGGKAYLMMDIENSLIDFLLYPDVKISYPIVTNTVSIYAGATGGLGINSLKSLSDDNPFVSPTLFLTQTNEQYNLFAGVNGKIGSYVNFGIKASYQSIEDQVLFIRNNSKSDGTFNSLNTFLGYEFGNSFNVIYDDVTNMSFFSELEIDVTQRFQIGLNGEFNSYSTTKQQEAWNLPKFEGTIFGKYKKDKWYAATNIFYVGDRKDLTFDGTFPSTIRSQNIDGYVDVNLNGGYNFNDLVSAFIKLNNILNNDYQRFANFNVQGFQILAGVSYRFDF